LDDQGIVGKRIEAGAPMHFGNPTALWLLLTWPILVWLGWSALRWRRRVAERIGAPEILSRLHPASVERWRRRRLALGLLAALLLMVASARPQYGRIEKSIRGYGINVMIGLDVSRSMLAGDVAPSRLDAAKRALGQFLRQIPSDRVGVMAFAGDAIVNCPMTLDHDMARLILDSLDTEVIGDQGTDLGKAIRTAQGAFERGGGAGDRVLALVTDGEDNEGQAAAAARAFGQQGMRIYCVGIGTAAGTALRDPEGGFIEDAGGNKVNSRLRMDTLTAMAEAAGGKAFDGGVAPEDALNQVAAAIGQLQKSEVEARRQTIYQDQFIWFLAPALLLMVWMLALRPEQETATAMQGCDSAIQG
jgi:Ca-activated chloride channel family protein